MTQNVTRNHKIMALLGTMLVMFLASLDMTVVSTAMPKIVQSLNGMKYYSWIFTIYTLVSTIFIPIFGKLSDIYGRKYFMVFGVVMFLIGSALCGASQNIYELIAFRGLQGIGAGSIMGISMAALADVFSPKELGKYMGIMMSFSALSSIIGPALGGYITDHWSWRWTFYINIPVGILAIIVLVFGMPLIKHDNGYKKVDYAGAALTALTFATLLLALTWGGNKYTWSSSTIIGLLVFSAIAFVILLIVEFKVSEPIIPIYYFKRSIFTVSTIVNFFVSIAMFGVIMYIPLYMQNVMRITATSSGAITTPLMLSLMVAAIVSGQLISRLGIYKVLVIVGTVVATVGAFLFTTITPRTAHGSVIAFMIVFGFGNGMIMPSITIAIQNIFTKKEMGAATASLQFFKTLGGSVGVAVLGAILTAGISTKPSSPQVAISQLDTALHQIFWVCVGIVAVTVFVSFFLKQIPIRKEELVEEE